MRFAIGVTSPDAADELRDLREWIANESELRAGVTMTSVGTGGPEDMGATLDLIEFAISSGISVASVVVAIAAWRESRRSRPAVEFHHGAGQRQLLTMSASDGTTIEEITLKLGAGADGPEA